VAVIVWLAGRRLAMAICASSVLFVVAARGVAQDPPTRPGLSRADIEKIVQEYLQKNPALVPGAAQPAESALDRLQVFGDMRVREEYSFQVPGHRDRNRLRLRLRVGASLVLSDEWSLGARLRTGDPDDPRSPHVTLGDGFDSLAANLDRAFLAYRPEWSPGLSVQVGKFNHPFGRNPVYGELVWDADVQPEGMVFSYSPRPGDGEGLLREVTVTAAVYSLIEQGDGDDASMAALELRASLGLTERVASRVSVAYYHYGDTSPGTNTELLADNRGNATADTDGDGKADSFVSNFGIVHGIAALTYDGLSSPVTLAGEVIHNMRASIGGDTGWSLGLSCGESERAGDFRGYYQWQVVERDAVFSTMAQDDFLLATNHRSHVLGLNYQVRDDIGVHVWALVSAAHAPSTGGAPEQDQWRVRLDVNVKF
jgi:Putative porin